MEKSRFMKVKFIVKVKKKTEKNSFQSASFWNSQSPIPVGGVLLPKVNFILVPWETVSRAINRFAEA